MLGEVSHNGMATHRMVEEEETSAQLKTQGEFQSQKLTLFKLEFEQVLGPK